MNHPTHINDCRAISHVVRAHPPRFVHWTVALLLLSVLIAFLFTAWTEAQLVVRASGRVRPVSEPVQIFSGERFGANQGARIVEVNCRKGDRVSNGQVLVRLDTVELDNRIDKIQRTIVAGAAELAQLERLAVLMDTELQVAEQKAALELERERTHVRQATRKQEADVRIEELAWEEARDQHERNCKIRNLNTNGVSDRQLVESKSKMDQAAQRLAAAQQPIGHERVQVAEQSLQLTREQNKVRREELRLQQHQLQAELDSVRMDLENLQHARQQFEIRSTVDGVVLTEPPRSGDVIAAGKPIVEIAEQQGPGLRFRMEVNNRDIGQLSVGMPAKIKLNAFDFRQYGTVPGRVVFVSPDSEADRPGAAVKSPARYHVEIEFDQIELTSAEHTGEIQLGMAGAAEIVTSKKPLLQLLTQRIHQSIAL